MHNTPSVKLKKNSEECGIMRSLRRTGAEDGETSMNGVVEKRKESEAKEKRSKENVARRKAPTCGKNRPLKKLRASSTLNGKGSLANAAGGVGHGKGRRSVFS